MFSWPDPGTRVTVRYRRPAGSVPPLTDAVGHLLAIDPLVRVRTKTGAVVEFVPADVVALRVLTDAPVRTSAIRALEHAAAAARPGAEQEWLEGWLLRAGVDDITPAANSAVPLDLSARFDTIPAIAGWYRHRGLDPRLAVPDRLLPLPPGLAVERAERVLVRDVSTGSHAGVTLDSDGHAGATFGTAGIRAVVTDAPDGTRWVGLFEVGGDNAGAQRGCEALLAWGADRGATRGYLVVPDNDATNLADALGFRLHHRRRYLTVPPSAWDTV
jgi:N-acetylglutamate synthase